MRDLARKFVGNDKKLYHEITLSRKDLTMDKVDNFFLLLGQESDDEETVYKLKRQAVVDMWVSLADVQLGQTVIFVNTKRRAQELAEFLRSEGYEAGQIHGDMDKSEREKVFSEFKQGKRPSLVATNVLSRGIDNPNVTLVINIDLPQKRTGGGMMEADPETFVHRIGRSGRWTKRGTSVSLISPGIRHEIPIMKSIEAALFANDDVNRPLIPVSDASMMGEAVKKRIVERFEEQK